MREELAQLKFDELSCWPNVSLTTWREGGKAKRFVILTLKPQFRILTQLEIFHAMNFWSQCYKERCCLDLWIEIHRKKPEIPPFRYLKTPLEEQISEFRPIWTRFISMGQLFSNAKASRPTVTERIKWRSQVLNQRPLYCEAGAVSLSNYRSPRINCASYSDLLHYLSVPRLSFQTYNLLIMRRELCRWAASAALVH